MRNISFDESTVLNEFAKIAHRDGLIKSAAFDENQIKEAIITYMLTVELSTGLSNAFSGPQEIAQRNMLKSELRKLLANKPVLQSIPLASLISDMKSTSPSDSATIDKAVQKIGGEELLNSITNQLAQPGDASADDTDEQPRDIPEPDTKPKGPVPDVKLEPREEEDPYIPGMEADDTDEQPRDIPEPDTKPKGPVPDVKLEPREEEDPYIPGMEADDRAVEKMAGTFYDVSGETGEKLIGDAHPGGMKTELTHSKTDEALVETIVEQQKKDIEVARSVPKGTYAVLMTLHNNLKKMGHTECLGSLKSIIERVETTYDVMEYALSKLANSLNENGHVEAATEVRGLVSRAAGELVPFGGNFPLALRDSGALSTIPKATVQVYDAAGKLVQVNRGNAASVLSKLVSSVPRGASLAGNVGLNIVKILTGPVGLAIGLAAAAYSALEWYMKEGLNVGNTLDDLINLMESISVSNEESGTIKQQIQILKRFKNAISVDVASVSPEKLPGIKSNLDNTINSLSRVLTSWVKDGPMWAKLREGMGMFNRPEILNRVKETMAGLSSYLVQTKAQSESVAKKQVSTSEVPLPPEPPSPVESPEQQKIPAPPEPPPLVESLEQQKGKATERKMNPKLVSLRKQLHSALGLNPEKVTFDMETMNAIRDLESSTGKRIWTKGMKLRDLIGKINAAKRLSGETTEETSGKASEREEPTATTTPTAKQPEETGPSKHQKTFQEARDELWNLANKMMKARYPENYQTKTGGPDSGMIENIKDIVDDSTKYFNINTQKGFEAAFESVKNTIQEQYDVTERRRGLRG